MKTKHIKVMTIDKAFLIMLDQFDDMGGDLRKEWKYRANKGQLSDRLMTFELIKRGYRNVPGGWI